METEDIRQTLQSEEERLSALRDDIRAGDDLDVDQQLENGGSGGELSTVDQHPADAASEQVQREVSLSMLEQIEAELADVERALGKLDQGTYGTCEACGQTISPERLEALPATRFCLDDAAQAEAEIRLDSTVDSPAIDTDASTAI